MVNISDLEEVRRLLMELRRSFDKVDRGERAGWKTTVRNPLTGEEANLTVPTTKRNEIKADRDKKLLALANKIKAVDWTKIL